MRARDLLSVLLVLGTGGVACGELKIAADDDAGTGGLPDGGTPPDPNRPDGALPPDGDSAPPVEKTVKLPVSASSIYAGSIAIAADSAGEVSLAWMETPSAQRHLHVARIAGGEDPPRVVITSDTALEASATFVGQAVSTFTPSKGCFGVVWGQGGVLRIAPVAADAKPTPVSTLATVSAGAVPRLSQVRAATDGAGQTLVAWSEVARYNGDATGVFRSASVGFDASCAPGLVSIDADPLSTGPLPYVAPPAGAAELALSRVSGVFRAAAQTNTSGTVFGVEQRPRNAGAWGAATAVDPGGTVTAGGSVGIAPNGADLAVAYYRRTSDTTGDLVVATLGPDGVRTGESVLESSVLIGTAATTNLEAARLAVAGRTAGGAVIAAVFARDANTSELRVYRADKAAPGGFRSELVETGVFGPRGGADAHPLVDVAVDGAGRIHVAWRSGVSKAIGYVRLPP